MRKKIAEIKVKIKEKINRLKKIDIKAIVNSKIAEIVKDRKSSLWAVVIFSILVILIFILLFFFVGHEKYTARKPIKVSGNIEGTEVRISFRVQGKILELLTDEGMVVRVGDIIARLDTDELSSIKKEKAAALKSAEFEYELARDNHVRAENLYKEGSMSDQERETYQTEYDAAMAKVEELRAALDLATIRLGYADLAAPLNGYVLTKSAEAGEVIHIGATVVTAIDLNDVWVTAYIEERDMGKVRLGQKAYVVTDSFPRKKYDAWVSYISQEAEFTPKYIQTQTERVKLVYRIKVRVDNSELELNPGIPADAYILTGE